METVNNLTLTINGEESLPVPAGTIRTVRGKALWQIALTNNGAVITTLNNIKVSLRREPQTIDDVARRM